MKIFAPTLIALTIPTFAEAYNVGGSFNSRIGPFRVVTSGPAGACRPSSDGTRRRSRIGPPARFGLMTPADIQAMRHFGKEVFHQAREEYSPAYQIVNDDKQFQVKLDVPGVKMEDLNINLEKDGKVLTLSGSREKVAEDGSSYSTKFSQSFALGGHPTIDTDQFAANLQNGVLIVSAPKNVQIVKDTVKTIPITEMDSEAVKDIRQTDDVAGEALDEETADDNNEKDKDDPTEDEPAEVAAA